MNASTTEKEIEKEERHSFTIIVNGRERDVDSRQLTFDEVVTLAFGNAPKSGDIIFTVTYRKAAGPKHEGTLVEGETVTIKDGTVFNVSKTHKS